MFWSQIGAKGRRGFRPVRAGGSWRRGEGWRPLVRALVVVALAWLLTVALSPSPVPAVIGANRTSAASAEAQVASWSRTYGGTSDDEARAIVPTSDGGYVVAGITQSFGAGSRDVWVLKLDGSGNVQWQKTYGGPGADAAFDMARTSDGDYVVAGQTQSFGAGGNDVWVLKLDSSGNVQWQKTYGGTNEEWARAIVPSDGGYVVAGAAGSVGGQDAWVLKLDGSGNVVWQKIYGGAKFDWAGEVIRTSDGGYLVAGATQSFGAGGYDAWVLKLDGSGNVQWQKTYGGPRNDYAYALSLTLDGGYLVAGATESFGAGSYDVWVLKLDGSGDVVWQKTYGGGGTNWDVASAIVPTADGGYVVAGRTGSFGAGGDDVWVLKLDGSGNVQWEKTYGGPGDDAAFDMALTSDGGYAVTGRTLSFGAGQSDVWVLKLETDGTMRGCPSGFVRDSTASVSSTSVSPSNSSAVVQATSASPVASSAVIRTSSASGAEVCSGIGFRLYLPLVLRMR
jgi:predicted secreted protein